MAPKRVIYRYSVSGFGMFPLDMLRYDSAWPESEQDTYAILNQHQQRTIRLVGMRRPTIGRWQSFVWTVEPGMEEVRVW